jgi:hypothetical protein
VDPASLVQEVVIVGSHAFWPEDDQGGLVLLAVPAVTGSVFLSDVGEWDERQRLPWLGLLKWFLCWFDLLLNLFWLAICCLHCFDLIFFQFFEGNIDF